MGSIRQHIFFYRGYCQALFVMSLVVYAWFIPPSHPSEEIIDVLIDILGVTSLLSGELLRIWVVSHGGKSTRSRRLKAPVLVTTGPYTHTRNPIYIGNFLIGLGMVTLSENFVFLPLYLVLFVFLYRAIVSAEEVFLRERFCGAYDNYRRQVPKWVLRPTGLVRGFAFGAQFPMKEIGTAWGVFVGALFFEWLRWPHHKWAAALLGQAFWNIS